MTKKRLAVIGVFTVALIAGMSCSLERTPKDRSEQPKTAEGEISTASPKEGSPPEPRNEDDDLSLPRKRSPTWIDRYHPGRAFNGYTLVFYRKRSPMLIDMNGNVVHSWPRVRAIDRLRLSKTGTLLLIGTDKIIREYDWDSNQIWQFDVDEKADFPHHDLIWLRNGNVLLIYRSNSRKTDYLLEVNRKKEIVWRWDASEHLVSFGDKVTNENDPTHINSVHELPPNKLSDEGDSRFDPGNILVSARQMNTIFIIDKASRDVVWQYDEGLDWQHEARMIGKGFPHEGNVLIFNNNANSLHEQTTRRSSVLEINPADSSVVFQYSPYYFFSSAGGAQQDLPNGNILITSTRGGRIFEIDREGQIVWQWIPPGLPLRAWRYPYDHCPQFKKLDKPTEKLISPSDTLPFVSRDLHIFAHSLEIEIQEIGGKERRLLKPRPRTCRSITFPPHARLRLGYGLNLKELDNKHLNDYDAEFSTTMRLDGSTEELVLMEDTINASDASTWRKQEIKMYEHAFQTVTLCLNVVSTKLPNDSFSEQVAVWERPRVFSRYATQIGRNEDTDEEIRKLMEKRLEALGYID